MTTKTKKSPFWIIPVYSLCMMFSFFAGNIFIDSYDVFIIRFLYPDADILLIFFISLLVLLFLYTYFRFVLRSAFLATPSKIVFLIFTWFGLMGIFLQNMLVPLNHFISYLELALISFLFGALLLSQISDKYEGKLKIDYLRFIIGLVIVNALFIFIKRIVFENLGTSGIDLVAEIDLLGATFNITSFLLLIFIAILGLMIWSMVKNFQIMISDIKKRKDIELGFGNKNLLGIILNQGAILISLLILVFISFYFMKNQNILKDFLHYSFSANVNYYATMKWAYLSNISFFIPFMAMYFYFDLSLEEEIESKIITASAPTYNFNIKMVLDKVDLEQIFQKTK